MFWWEVQCFCLPQLSYTPSFYPQYNRRLRKYLGGRIHHLSRKWGSRVDGWPIGIPWHPYYNNLVLVLTKDTKRAMAGSHYLPSRNTGLLRLSNYFQIRSDIGRTGSKLYNNISDSLKLQALGSLLLRRGTFCNYRQPIVSRGNRILESQLYKWG